MNIKKKSLATLIAIFGIRDAWKERNRIRKHLRTNAYAKARAKRKAQRKARRINR